MFLGPTVSEAVRTFYKRGIEQAYRAVRRKYILPCIYTVRITETRELADVHRVMGRFVEASKVRVENA